MDGETVATFDPTSDHIQGIYSLQLKIFFLFFLQCLTTYRAEKDHNNCLEIGAEQGKDSTRMHCLLS